MDYADIRKKMVEQQLVQRGIKDPRLLEIFKKIERHRFIPEELQINAYADFPLPIGNGQTISQPYIAALMTENLELTGEEKVLEIGTGSGYQAVILSKLAKEVYTIERLSDLAEKAEAVFNELGCKDIKLKIGDGTLGWPQEAPFDRIIVTAASPSLPLPLAEQLKEGGRLILPLENNLGQALTLVEKKEGKLHYQKICGCIFVPLIGRYGYKNEGYLKG